MSNKQISFERIITAMNLRLPQKEALEKFHQVMNSSDTTLRDLDPTKVAELFHNFYPEWQYEHESVEFTFHLATGVGKTRLIGAVMAYLYLSGESKNFMIVSPRAEIVRKFKNVCVNENKYIFVDTTLVDYPSLFDSEANVSDFDQATLFGSGPRIWVISPQALTANGARMKKKGEYDKCSPIEYIQNLNDLVVFFDESHHLGLDSENDSVWRSELNNLKAKMIIGTTASVSENQNNIIYSYDLKRCLNEHLYTKFVRMMPDKKPESISAEDYDKITLRFALQRLDTKQKFIDDYCSLNGINRTIKATMLVACEDIPHAEATTKWLQNYLGSRNKVLLVHSQLNESEFIPALKSIEEPSSPVKVVVNVGMLNEGWDVSNIYVISPLRAMASTTLVTQIMGRGLRLPFGEQTGEDEVDTLDVLCFGRETMQEIVERLTKEGFGTKNTGITVDAITNSAHPQDDFVPKKKITLNIVGANSKLEIPQYKMNKAALPLDKISIPALKAQDVHFFLINDLKTIKRLGCNIEIPREDFLGMVTTEILKQCKYLKYARHFMTVKALVQNFLIASKFTEDTIQLDPTRVVAHIKNCLDQLNKQQKVTYERLEENLIIDLSAIQVNVPETYAHPNDNSMNYSLWSNRVHKGIPFGGWVRCIYEAVPFDTSNEYHIAKIIDSAEEVKSWFRNLPGILTLLTPVGNYSPDFAIFLNLDEMNILLEIKDDDRFGREDQDATIKANAAREWCNAQTEATGKRWEYWLLLDTDAEACETFDDIMDSSDIGD